MSQRWAERGSCGGVSGLADRTEEGIAGALHGLGGVEVGGGGRELVEGFEGDAGPEEAFRAGEGSEVLVGGGDIVLSVGLPDAAAGAGDVGGEETGPVEVEEGAEAVAEEGVELGDEIVGDVDVAERAFGWRTMEPFLDSTSALSFDRRGRDLVKVGMWSRLSRSATSRLMYSEPLSAWKALTVKGKAEMRSFSTGTMKCWVMRGTAPRCWNCVTSSTTLMT